MSSLDSKSPGHHIRTCSKYHSKDDQRRDPRRRDDGHLVGDPPWAYSISECRNDVERMYHPDTYKTKACGKHKTYFHSCCSYFHSCCLYLLSFILLAGLACGCSPRCPPAHYVTFSSPPPPDPCLQALYSSILVCWHAWTDLAPGMSTGAPPRSNFAHFATPSETKVLQHGTYFESGMYIMAYTTHQTNFELTQIRQSPHTP